MSTSPSPYLVPFPTEDASRVGYCNECGAKVKVTTRAWPTKCPECEVAPFVWISWQVYREKRTS